MYIFCASFLPLLASVVQAQMLYPAPGACSGACGVHDPSVFKRSDGTYFRFGTGGGIAAATAKSISGPWTALSNVLPGGSKINNAGSKDIWAPDVSLVGSTYYCYYAVSQFGSQNSAVGVATSSSMDAGSWTDHGSINLPQSSAYNTIDPNLITANGVNYLSFGSFWGDIYQIQLGSLTSASGTSPKQIAYNSTSSHPLEGSFQIYRAPYYYLFFSSGDCCDQPPNLAKPGNEYKMMVCRSSSPTGPFVDKAGKNCVTQNGGTQILASHDDVYAPGGGGVLTDPQLGHVLYYHYIKKSSGNYGATYFGWNVLNWSDWPLLT